MKKLEVDGTRMPEMFVSTLAPPGAGAGGASDSEAMTDTSSVQSSDMDRSSIRSVDERVEVSAPSAGRWRERHGRHSPVASGFNFGRAIVACGTHTCRQLWILASRALSQKLTIQMWLTENIAWPCVNSTH